MPSIARVLVIAMLSGCTRVATSDGGFDAGDGAPIVDGSNAESSSSCPSQEPGLTSCTDDSGPCTYGGDRCSCRMNQWECEPSSCPLGPLATADACDMAGAACGRSLERICVCVAPEMTWLCCVNLGYCPDVEPAEGSLCCSLPKGAYCTWGARIARCSEMHWVSLDAGASDASTDAANSRDQ